MTAEKIIALSAPVEIQAGDAKRVPTFEATIYTGGALELGDWDMPVVIDLAGLTRGNVLVANLDHDSTRRVGNFDVENDGRVLKARGIASAVTAARDEVIESAKAGYIWQASVEVRPTNVEPIEDGESITINARTITGPVYITRQGVLKGFAFVSHGADDDTTVAIAAARRKRKMTDFMEWATECGLDTSLMTADQMAMIRANYNGRSAPSDEDHAAVAPLIMATADPVDAENRRLRQIEAATAGDWDEEGQMVQLKAAAYGNEISIDELLSSVRKIRMDQTMKTLSTGPSVNYGKGDINAEVIQAAFCLNGGITSPERHFHESVLNAADKMRGGVSLQSLIMQAACANGYQASRCERITQANLRAVLHAAFQPIKAYGYSTMDLPNVMSNISNLFVRDGFNSVDTTSLRISSIRPVKDFREIKTVSLTGAMQFLPIAADGELKHGSLGEEVYTNKADTFGVMFSITRQDLINDNADVLSAVPRRIGRGAMLALNHIVWTEFLNNSTFFSAGNGNVSTGAGSALSLAGLAAAEKTFVNMTDPDGKPLGVSPAILLVPPTLAPTARQLMNSQFTVTGTDSTLPSGNPFTGSYRVETSPYMENASYTGFSSAAWYLLAAPSQLPVIEIAALNGQISPTVETADVAFNSLGIQMRGFSDIGCALQAPEGGVRSAGS